MPMFDECPTCHALLGHRGCGNPGCPDAYFRTPEERQKMFEQSAARKAEQEERDRMQRAREMKRREVRELDCWGKTIFRLVEESAPGSGWRPDGWQVISGIDYDRREDAEYALHHLP